MEKSACAGTSCLQGIWQAAGQRELRAAFESSTERGGDARGIAEGSGKGSDAKFAIHLKRARAAGHELAYALPLCRDLGFLEETLHDELTCEVVQVRKMISGLVKRMSA